MAEIGVNGQWGIFSMVIPGRVGYQCSNFYRHLVKTGQVKDSNYVIDEQGKAHYLFSKGVIKKNSRKRLPNESEDDSGGNEGNDGEGISSVAVAVNRSSNGHNGGDSYRVSKRTSGSETTNKKKRKKTKRSDDDDDDDEEDLEDDEEYRPSASRRRQYGK